MRKTIQLKIMHPMMQDASNHPKYATAGSAGLDLRACIENTIELAPGEVTLINTGVAIYIQDCEIAALILPRSGLGHKHGIILGNGVGLIDSDYQGELKVSCYNRSKESFAIEKGLRIAQIMFINIQQVDFNIVPEFVTTNRGAQGFGHSGIA